MDDKNKDEESEIQKLTREKDEYLDGWKRAEANLINYKKDELKRLEEIARFANEDLVADLITVLDSFDLGIAAMEKSGNPDKGAYLIRSQLEDILRSRGLEKIKVNVGDKFNPSHHEIVGEIEGGESGNIAEEVAAGYIINGKVLRPSRVKVFN
ncbi:MAG: nucleotide exchange factor GrpE [Candidatus Colwellbacteria bacterium]|nr:nucleotide exchange factor GrpE [Candidatus Colwellbacteria bacterium]